MFYPIIREGLFHGSKKRHLAVLFLSLIVFLVFPLFASADEPHFPEPVGYVNDFADMIDPRYEELTDQLIRDLESKTTAEIAVVTIESLEGLSVEEYAVKLFEKWGIGKKEEDNGVLLLVAREERELRIEVGYGLEPAITDARAGRILDTIIEPRFKQQEFGLGVYEGVSALARLIADYYQVERPEMAAPEPSEEAGGTPGTGGLFSGAFFLFLCFGLLFLLVFGIIITTMVFSRLCPRCRTFNLHTTERVLIPATASSYGKALVLKDCFHCGYHAERTRSIARIVSESGGGGFSGGGGGGGGFGGGSSGGGGASGRW